MPSKGHAWPTTCPVVLAQIEMIKGNPPPPFDVLIYYPMSTGDAEIWHWNGRIRLIGRAQGFIGERYEIQFPPGSKFIAGAREDSRHFHVRAEFDLRDGTSRYTYAPLGESSPFREEVEKLSQLAIDQELRRKVLDVADVSDLIGDGASGSDRITLVHQSIERTTFFVFRRRDTGEPIAVLGWFDGSTCPGIYGGLFGHAGDRSHVAAKSQPEILFPRLNFPERNEPLSPVHELFRLAVTREARGNRGNLLNFVAHLMKTKHGMTQHVLRNAGIYSLAPVKQAQIYGTDGFDDIYPDEHFKVGSKAVRVLRSDFGEFIRRHCRSEGRFVIPRP